MTPPLGGGGPESGRPTRDGGGRSRAEYNGAVRLLDRFSGFSRNARLLLATSFCVGLSMAVTMLYLNFYLQSLGLTQQFIGMANAVPQAILVIVGLPAGRLIDRYGPRLGLLAGMAAAGLGALGVALSSSPGMLLAFAGLQGVGAAFGFISGAPFLMANSGERERVALFSAYAAVQTGTAFLGSLAGGRLPGLFGLLLDTPAESVAPLRATMLAAALLWALAAVPIALTRRSPHSGEHDGHAGAAVTESRRAGFISRPELVMRLLLPIFLISLGAGQTIPFLNLYISGKFGIGFGSIGLFFALGALGTTVATLAQPVLAARFGKIQSVLIVQIASIPFLVILGFVPVFWLVALSFIVRNALMNMGNPVFQAFAQEQIPAGERATYSSLSAIFWSLGWAGGSVFSGWWRAQVGFELGFATLFGSMTFFYLVAIGLTYLFFVQRPLPGRATPP